VRRPGRLAPWWAPLASRSWPRCRRTSSRGRSRLACHGARPSACPASRQPISRSSTTCSRRRTTRCGMTRWGGRRAPPLGPPAGPASSRGPPTGRGVAPIGRSAPTAAAARACQARPAVPQQWAALATAPTGPRSPRPRVPTTSCQPARASSPAHTPYGRAATMTWQDWSPAPSAVLQPRVPWPNRRVRAHAAPE